MLDMEGVLVSGSKRSVWTVVNSSASYEGGVARAEVAAMAVKAV